VRSLYFKIFSASFLITFLSPENATSINMHVPFSLSRIIISGLLLGMVLSVLSVYYYYYYYNRNQRNSIDQFLIIYCFSVYKLPPL
jgi:hypothetical protein